MSLGNLSPFVMEFRSWGRPLLWLSSVVRVSRNGRHLMVSPAVVTPPSPFSPDTLHPLLDTLSLLRRDALSPLPGNLPPLCFNTLPSPPPDPVPPLCCDTLPPLCRTCTGHLSVPCVPVWTRCRDVGADLMTVTPPAEPDPVGRLRADGRRVRVPAGRAAQ